MAKFKSWEKSGDLFELKGGAIASKGSKPLDIRNYIRSDRFYTRSDSRLKSNIKDLGSENLLNINHIIPKSYNFKNDDLLHFGFIAQDVEKIYPNLVTVDSDGMKSVNYLEMIPLLLHKINDLERKVEELKNNK